MTGAELKAIRQSLGLSVISFGRALGYSGSNNTVNVQIRQFEAETRLQPHLVVPLRIGLNALANALNIPLPTRTIDSLRLTG